MTIEHTRASRVTVSAPAKINLSLQVGPLRSDGYHGMQSIMHAVEFGDTVRITLKPNGGGIGVSGNDAVDERQDLCRLAAAAYLDAIGVSTGVRIDLEKRIPIGGGLGGGSSDAASTLLALNALYASPLSHEDLESIGASIGSDVPFFFHTPAGVAHGRGELVDPVPPAGGYRVLIVDSGVAVSTASAYRWLDDMRARSDGDDSVKKVADPSSLLRPPEIWNYANDFLAPVCARFPVVSELLDRLDRLGASFTGLSGTGGCLFGVFSGEEEPTKEVSTLGKSRWWTQLLESANYPVLE